MLQFIFSHLWIVISAIIFVLGEYAFWYDAIDKYKRRDNPDDILGLILAHALVIGFVSFIYWIILSLIAK